MTSEEASVTEGRLKKGEKRESVGVKLEFILKD